MKFLRLFGSTSQRDTVLASIDYKILQKTVGVPGVGIMQGTYVPEPDYSEPFYVENITQETEILTIAGFNDSEDKQVGYIEIPVEYSTNGTTWNTFGTTGETPLTKTLQPGDKVYLRAEANTWSERIESGLYIARGNVIYGVSKVGGNIMSLLYGSSFTGDETTFPNGSAMNFMDLFTYRFNDFYNRKLISASELILPATTLTESCYNGMFHRCMSLTTAPALPATTLAIACYCGMFGGCKALTAAPALPATTLAKRCYECMFEDCKALTTAPELPAATLVSYCYSGMFTDCTNINYIKCLATTNILSNHSAWLSGVAESGTFVKAASATWTIGGDGIPEGWTVQDAA